jgi:hypothetical protein
MEFNDWFEMVGVFFFVLLVGIAVGFTADYFKVQDFVTPIWLFFIVIFTIIRMIELKIKD